MKKAFVFVLVVFCFAVRSFCADYAQYCSDDQVACLEEVDFSVSSSNKLPLILVHGINFQGVPAQPTPQVWKNFWNFFKNSSLADKFKLYCFDYQSNIISVTNLGIRLRETLDKATKADPSGFWNKDLYFVCHSMGGLVVRSALNLTMSDGMKIGDRTKKIITLGTPHHGSPMANADARDNAIADKKIKDDAITFDFLAWIWNQGPGWNQLNRTDLRWDNFDNLFVSDDLENNFFLKALNSDIVYDNKIIAYFGMVIPENTCWTDIYCYGSSIMKKGLNLDGDGIVPVASAQFNGHSVISRPFNDYDHREMVRGKAETENDPLFQKIAKDLLEIDSKSLKITQISPTGAIGTSKPKFVWNAVPSATGYVLSAGDPIANDKIYKWYSPIEAGCATGQGTCIANPNLALAVGQAFWKITATDNLGNFFSGGPMSFTIATGSRELIVLDVKDHNYSNATTTIFRIKDDGKKEIAAKFAGVGLAISKNESGGYFVLRFETATTKNILKISSDGKQSSIPLRLEQPVTMILEKNGNFLIGDNVADMVYRFDPNAGTFEEIYKLSSEPYALEHIGLAIDAFENIIIASDHVQNNLGNSEIARIGENGNIVKIFAGTKIYGTSALVIDSAGNYIVSDYGTDSIWRVSPNSDITVVARDDKLCCNMFGLAYDPSRDVFFALMFFDKSIAEIQNNGTVKNLAVDGGLEYPTAIAVFTK